jgi:hypothetical protein
MGKGKVLGEEIMSLLRSCPMRPLVNYSGYNSVVAWELPDEGSKK